MTNQERELVNEGFQATNAAWALLTDPVYQNMGATLGALLKAREALNELISIKPRKSPAKKEG